jgi:SAM-dependent methyltransferase
MLSTHLPGAHFDIIEKWRTRESSNWHYFELAESDDWIRAFWQEGGRYRSLFDQLDLRRTVELACGHGRHSVRAAPNCGTLYAVDSSPEAISHVRDRLAQLPHVHAVLTPDGASLPGIEDGSITAIFSYDAMVHFEMITVARYIEETARVLAPAGRGLFHHSNYTKNPAGPIDANPGWRNFMSVEIMTYLLSRAGLRVLHQSVFDACGPQTDALTLFEKPAPGAASS